MTLEKPSKKPKRKGGKELCHGLKINESINFKSIIF